MILEFNILSPNNTGAPDYDICGQSASVINNNNLKVDLKLNGLSLFTTNDLSTATIPSTPFTVGTKTISLFTYSSITGFVIKIAEPQIIGIENILDVTISKVGYQSFTNSFKLYNYDIGGSGNPNFDFYLINNINNLDSDGFQTKAFSQFTVIRKPFTNDTYYYNLVGTQGIITYVDYTTSTPIPLTTGQNGVVCNNTAIKILQTITVSNIYSTVQDSCSLSKISQFLVWKPNINTTVTCTPSCNDNCSLNLGSGTYQVIVDLSNLSCVNVDTKSTYVYNYDPNIFINTKVYDYQGIEINSTSTNIGITDCGTLCSQSPIILTLPILPILGDILIKTEFIVTDGGTGGNAINLIDCWYSTPISLCYPYSIKETDNCGEYIASNCSFIDTVLTIKQLQDDKTFLIIAQIPILALSTITTILQVDGVYLFENPNIDGINTDSYIVINFCNFKICLFSFLSTFICNKKQCTCGVDIKKYYDFNAFILNAHTYFALLNEEYNFNYIYNAITDTKINDLYTIKQYLDNMSTYCEKDCSPCKCD
jgi:hypothetical protein